MQISHYASYVRGWHYLLLVVLLLVPLLILVSYLQTDFVLPTYARLGLLSDVSLNSFAHVLMTLAGTVILGVPLAWLSSVCRFPTMESFWWALLLPIAVPTFALAAVYEQSGIFAMLDPVYRLSIYSSLNLYPLVYLVMRIAFRSQNSEYIDGSRCLGTGALKGMFRIGVPMNRPALVAALLLVAMEVLSDVATPRMLEFHSIATVIYQATAADAARPIAIELSLLLIICFLLVLWLEDAHRGNRRYHQIISGFRVGDGVALSTLSSWFAVLLSLAVLIAAALFPLMSLVTVSPEIQQTSLEELTQPALTSFTLACVTSLLVIVLASILCFGVRYNPSRPLLIASWLPGLAFVIPGSVLALLILLPLERMDSFFGALLQSIYSTPIDNPVQSTLVPAVYLLVVKFLAIGTFAIRATMLVTSDTMDLASRSLGRGTLATFTKIHLPFLLPTLAAVFFLVFAETLKEAAIVLVLVPEENQVLVNRALASISSHGVVSSSREIVLIIGMALIPALILTTIINMKKT